MILTALHHLRVQPDALAHFLLAVPDEVLRRCGVVLATMARGEDEEVELSAFDARPTAAADTVRAGSRQAGGET